MNSHETIQALYEEERSSLPAVRPRSTVWLISEHFKYGCMASFHVSSNFIWSSLGKLGAVLLEARHDVVLECGPLAAKVKITISSPHVVVLGSAIFQGLLPVLELGGARRTDFAVIGVGAAGLFSSEIHHLIFEASTATELSRGTGSHSGRDDHRQFHFI